MCGELLVKQASCPGALRFTTRERQGRQACPLARFGTRPAHIVKVAQPHKCVGLRGDDTLHIRNEQKD